MSVFALTNCYAFVAGYDFTSDTNKLEATMEGAVLDATPFGETWVKNIGGLKSVGFEMAGFFQSATDQAPDPQAFPMLGTVDQVFTFGPDASEGNPAYMWKGMKSSYTLGGEVGEVAPFALSSVGSNGVGVVRGALTKARGTVSATGALGTGVELAAASATQSVYATVHVFSAGTTMTLQLQSDDNAGFTTPTTLATIAGITSVGGTWVTPVTGPLTDTFFRFNVSAITGSFIVAAAIGVQ